MPSSSSSSSSILPTLSPSQTKFLLTATATAALTTLSILTTQHLTRRHKRITLREDVEGSLLRGNAAKGADPGSEQQEQEEEEMMDFTRPLHQHHSRSTTTADPSHSSRSALKKPTSELIIRESLARNYVFFGPEGMSRIREAFVVVVGLGGVGSAAATMLVRSGVKKVRLVDFDQVSLSSLNVGFLSLCPLSLPPPPPPSALR